jgi:putative flippase GtrA
MRDIRGQELRQFVRFAIVGLIQNGFNVGAFALAIAYGVPYLLAALLAAVMALSISFLLNRRWTFPGRTDRSATRARRFVTVWLVFVVLALPILAFLVSVVGLPRVLSQAIIIMVGAPASYLLQRRWTFGLGNSGLGNSGDGCAALNADQQTGDERLAVGAMGSRARR